MIYYDDDIYYLDNNETEDSSTGFSQSKESNLLARMFPPSQLRGPLMEDYQHLITISRIRKPSFPKTSFRNWLVAGTATAAIYVLSKYMFITTSY